MRLDGQVDRYSVINAPVLLLGGTASPPAITRRAIEELERVLPRSEAAIFEGVGHIGPDGEAPTLIAQRVAKFLSAGCGY